jgi:hypothetical protein
MLRAFNLAGIASYLFWAASRFVFGGNPATDTVSMLLAMIGG